MIRVNLMPYRKRSVGRRAEDYQRQALEADHLMRLIIGTALGAIGGAAVTCGVLLWGWL